MQAEVKVNSRAAEATLRQLASSVDGPRRAALMEVLGKGLETDLQAHFQRRNASSGNKRGFPRQNFWASVRRGTTYRSATMDTATVGIATPETPGAFKTHLEGRTIRPRNAKFLAIPMRAEAYGKSPRSGLIPDLFFLRSKTLRGGFLARRDGSGALRVYYRLLKSVTIPRDPDALPPQADLDESTVRRTRTWLAREISSSGGSTT